MGIKSKMHEYAREQSLVFHGRFYVYWHLGQLLQQSVKFILRTSSPPSLLLSSSPPFSGNHYQLNNKYLWKSKNLLSPLRTEANYQLNDRIWAELIRMIRSIVEGWEKPIQLMQDLDFSSGNTQHLKIGKMIFFFCVCHFQHLTCDSETWWGNH